MTKYLNRSSLSEWMTIISFLVWAASGAGFIHRLMAPNPALPLTAGVVRVEAILIIGLCAAGGHGLLWALGERIFRWDHHEGPGAVLPRGWSAVVLSLSMTIPLVVLPAVYSSVFKVKMVQRGHLLASLCVLAAAAFAHLVAYGAKVIRFPGIRRLILSKNWTGRTRALVWELSIAILQFGSIVVVYRVSISKFSGRQEAILIPSLLSALVWLLGMLTFYLVKYPESLNDVKTAEQRRIIAALLLMIALEGGMLM